MAKPRGVSFKTGDARTIAAGKRGGPASVIARNEKRIAHWRALYPHIPPEDSAAIHALGYRAGLQAKYQATKRRTNRDEQRTQHD